MGGYAGDIAFSTNEAFTPGDGLTWTSSNTPIATVGATGLAAAGATVGSSTITATSGSVSGNTVLTVVSTDTTAPTTAAVVSPAANAASWNQANVTVTLTATDNAGGSGVQSLFYASTLTGGPTIGGSVAAATTSLLVVAEGTTTVNYHARDVAGNIEGDRTIVIRLDKTAPALTVPANMTVNAASPSGAVVSFAPTATDATSGVASLSSSPASGSTFPIGTTTVTATAIDIAGNTVAASFTVTVVKALSSITLTPADATINVGQTQPFTVQGTFSDGSTQILTGSSWAPLVSMPTARSSLQGAAVNGLLYAVGGHNGRDTPIVEAYNPASNAWTTPAPLNAPNYGGDTGRYQGSAVGVNGKLYMMGGWTTSPPLPSNTLSIYDPSTNTWSAGPAIPGSGYTGCSQAAVIGSKIYLLNACNGFSGYVQQLSIFDTTTNSWTVGPNAPRSHNAGLGAALNGKFYVTGGNDGTAQPQVDVYDPATNSWTTVGSMPVNLWSMAGDVINGKWYIVGGSDPTTNYKNTVWIYDPVANTWTSGLAAPTARSGAIAATINGKLYLVGGSNAAGNLSTLEVFDPNASGAAWSSGTPGVATLDSNGLATGVSAGRSTITATAGSISGNTTLTVVSPDAIAPITVATSVPGANGAGWNKTNVTVTLNATDNAGGSGVGSIIYSFNGAQNGGPFTVAGNFASVSIVNEGTTTINYHAVDNNGNVEGDHPLMVKIDTTAPFLSFPFNVTTQATSSAGATVTFSVSGSDGLSGLAGPVTISPLASGATFPPGTTHETVTASDAAGNAAIRNFDVVVNPAYPFLLVNGGTFTSDGTPHPATGTAKDSSSNIPVAGTFSFVYAPGGASAPVAAGRYSATATFTSADPAYRSVFPWTTMAPDPHATSAPASAEINGKLYVHGFDQDAFGNQSSFVPRLSIYDPASNTWTNGAPPSLVRAQSNVVAINGKLYVAGGCIMSDCSFASNALEIYDPVLNTWSNGAAIPTARFGAAAGAIGGKLYVTGGSFPSYTPTNTTEIYDPESNTWTTGTAIPTSRELPMTAVVNGELYVMGGYQRDPVNGPVNRVDVFNPATGWSTRSAMPTSRYGGAAGVIAGGGVIGGQIYVVGGFGIGSTLLAANQSYDPASDTWTEQAPMPTARTYVAGGVVNSKLYVIDGYGGTPLATNEAFDPSLTALITINPADTAPPTTNANVPQPNANGWYRFNFNVNLNAFDSGGAASPSGVQSITYTLTGAQTGGGTFNTSSTSIFISTEGTTTVTYHATDYRGNVEADKTLVVKLDRTSPSAANLGSITVNATSSAGAVVTFYLAPSDLLSGVDAVVRTQGLASGSIFPHGTTSEAFTITDKAGNNTLRSFSVTVNRTLLSIAVSPSTASVNVGRSQSFQALGHFTSGSDQMLPTSGGGGGGLTVPAGGTWQLHFAPLLNSGACTGRSSDNFSSQPFSPVGGVVQTSWGFPPIVQVDGTVTAQQVNITLACIPANGAVGSISATWTGVRYEGTATFGGSTTNVVVNGWSTKMAIPTARFAFGAATVNGIVYAMGGGNPSQSQPVDAYTPATNSWSTVSQMLTSREGAGVAALNGKIYVAGGHVSGGVASGVFEAYDPGTNSWSSLPSMPAARAHHAFVAAGGKLYAIGGDTGSNNSGATAVVESYDPSTNVWTTRAPMSTARTFIVAGALNNDTLIVVAGNSINGSSTELYDVAANTWTPGPAMLTPTGGMAAAVANNALFVFGGNGGLTRAHMFRPAGSSQPGGNVQPAGWAAMASMPTGRGELAVAAVGDVVYAIGGQVNSLGIATVEAFSTPPPFDFQVSSGGASSGGGGSSLPTVTWQSTSPSIAGINSSGFASGNAPGQTTIVATANGISCATTNTCASLTVNPPAHITLTLASGSTVFAFVTVTPIDPTTGQSEGTFDVPIDAPQTVEPGSYRLVFTPPPGYTVTPAQADFSLQAGSDVTVTLRFDPIDTTPPTVSCGSPDGLWHNADVSMACTASDAGGLLNAADASFTLSTSVAAGTETAAAPTNSRSVCDRYSNCLTAGPIGPIMVDRKVPSLTVSADTLVEATGAAGAAVPFAAATAVDAGSGLASVSCDRPSSDVFPIGVTTVHCSATDNAGNAASATFTVTVQDTTPPVVSCGSADGQWHNADVSIACTASDAVGLLNPADANFALATSVPAATETAAAATSSRVVCDTNGHCATAGPIGPIEVDKKAPSLTVSPNQTAEATGAAGAAVTFPTATATDAGSGLASVSCDRASGGTFTIGVTTVHCSAADNTGNTANGSFTVTVADTVRPVVTLFAPSQDAFIATAPALVPVEVEVIDAGGVLAVTINGINATLNGTTPLGTRWLANLSTPAGTALTINALATDLAANKGSLAAVIDNDGIAKTIDKGRTTAADQSGVFSSDFNNGTTAGTVIRAAAENVSVFPRGAAVGVTLASSGSARITACTGTIKSFVLNAQGESADVSCNGDTVTVKAVSTPNVIEVYKLNTGARILSQWQCAFLPLAYRHSPMCQLQYSSFSYQYDYLISLPQGQSVSTGSPVTASPSNTQPIHVTLIQVADDGSPDFPVADFDLDPSESADVRIEEGMNRQDLLTFSVLHGTVTFDVGGVTQTVVEGQQATITPDLTSPIVTVPANTTKEATSSSGAVVTFIASASDNVDGLTPVSCTPASGSTFALGTTTVVCAAADAHGNVGSASFAVTVSDTTKPTLTLPASITVDATGPAGAIVTYTASATDRVSGALAVTCTPSSGIMFPIGTSTVNCTAVDAAGNSVGGSFPVLVQAAAAQVTNLVLTVQGFNLAQGIENSLDTKLQNVLSALNAAKNGSAGSVCNQMNAFINETLAQSGKKLTVAQANQLIASAQRIEAVIGCQ